MAQSIQSVYQTEANLKQLLDNNVIAITRTDIHGNIFDANDAYANLVGYSRDELLSGQVKWKQFTAPECRHLDEIAIAQVKATGRAAPYEKEYIRKDGKRIPVLVGVTSGDNTGSDCLAFILDLSEQYNMLDRLRQSETEFKTLAETIPQIVWIADPDGRTYYANQRAYDYAGVSRNEDDGFIWQRILHPDDLTNTVIIWKQAQLTAQYCQYEARYQGADGNYRWFLVRAVPFCGTDNIIKWFGTWTDIDDQKRVEDELRHSKEEFRLVAEAIPQIVWTALPDGQIDYVNQRCAQYTNLGLEKLTGWNWVEANIVHPDDIAQCIELWTTALKTGDRYEIECRLLRNKDQTYRWHLCLALPFKNSLGEIIKWFGTCTDIDDQKMSVQQLRESEERFRTLADAIPQIVWTADAQGQIDFFNHRWFEYTGLTPKQSLSDGWKLLIHPEDLPRYVNEWNKAIETGDTCEMEFRLKRAVGLKRDSGNPYRWHLSRAVALRDGNGKITKWFATWTEIDNQKRTPLK